MTATQAAAVMQHCRREPSFFFDKFLGAKPWPYQIKIVESVRDNRITSVRSCHEIGKSFTAARVAIWFLMTHPDSIVVTTAPTARQVEDILWREIRTAYAKARYPLGGRCLTTKMEMSSSWYAVGLSTTEPDKFQGYHSDSGHLLVITDEAAGIDEPIFEAVRAVMTSEYCRLLMIGNPTSSSGTFYSSHQPKSLASQIGVSMFDTPNFQANGITSVEQLISAIESKKQLKMPAPYLVSPIWGYESLMEWGEESPMFQARALGTFPDQGDETLIPLSQITAAMTPERHEQVAKDGGTFYGVDIARFGNDRTVIIKRQGMQVQDINVSSKQDTMETAGKVFSLIDNDPLSHAYIDVIGLGAGVVDRINELQRNLTAEHKWQWARASAVNVSESADSHLTPDQKAQISKAVVTKFRNKRAELYWKLRGFFERGEIAIPDTKFGRDLAAELSAMQYKFESDGSIYIEEKKDIKKRLLKSPDLADALMLSFASGSSGKFHLSSPVEAHEQTREIGGKRVPVPAGEREPLDAEDEDFETVGDMTRMQF